MSLKVVKKVKANGGGIERNWRSLCVAKTRQAAAARYRVSRRQMGPETTISSGSPGTFRTTDMRQKCPVTTIIVPQSD
ncbi:hypothetical protein [Paraburkholderia sp. SIMBA_030]|uniref:hypothetical protein n=1 Tax=Paraburkholderia sp. SIMBA_030 TaxID=3085773 RepID=UPI00397A0A4C